MSPDELMTIHLAAAGGFASLVALASIWFMHHGRIDVCKECPHCQRIAREQEQKQHDLHHDMQHKGYGYRPETPDLFNCTDERCPRNKGPR